LWNQAASFRHRLCVLQYLTLLLCSNATMKNRVSTLRWWAEKIDKQNIIERDNKVLAVPCSLGSRLTYLRHLLQSPACEAGRKR
jgi:hypothetical protein